MEWTEETIVRLRELWTEGHSTAEIGRRLGVSKNAIVGKAHRLDLAARPSPIRRETGVPAQARPVAPRRLEGPTLPPLNSTSVNEMPPHREVAAPLAVARIVQVVPTRPTNVVPRSYARIVTCCWPIGEPGTRSFRFCDAQSEPGKPYCDEHARLAYVRVRDRREDAA